MKYDVISTVLVAFLLSGCQPADVVFNGAYRKGRFSGNKEAFPAMTHRQVLREANESFTYRGKSIHPGLVREFECWISDLNPVTFAVDVSAAFDSNEYSEETYAEDGSIRIKTDSGIYGYKRISSGNGVHVLKTSDYSGGSQDFGVELWVKFEIWQSHYPDGTPYDQLIMRLIRAK